MCRKGYTDGACSGWGPGMGARVATRWLAVRDLRLLRVFAVLRDGGGRRCPGFRRVLRHRCGTCWLLRWRRTGSWRGWRLSCARRTRGCGRRTRSRRLSWSGCGLTWRFCSGWCSGGRRSGRGPSRRRTAGTRGRAVTARERHGREEAGSGGAGGAAGLLAPAPGRGGLGFRGRRVLLPGVRDAVHGPGQRSCDGAAGLAGDRAGAGGLPAPVPAGLLLPGPGDGDGARPAEGDRQGPFL